jgi:peptidoglycan/LPS O-acetylase OafA/YrhL
MPASNTTGAVFSDSKTHYEILDGLRGVAAITVVVFHLLETFTAGNHRLQIINHGYLAVDFFFVLSGFVIGYAYDDRWQRMSVGDFFKRRLIRLHPMIVFGMVVGAAAFYLAASPELYPKLGAVPVWQMLAIMLIGFALVPVPPSLDIRGWNEMYPLNGPAWTLFLEYLANIAYALFLRRLSNRMLAVLVCLAAAATIHLAVTSPQGDLIGGWSLEPAQLRIGFTRLAYPFLAGLLLSRIYRPVRIAHAFLWCSLLVLAVLSFPRLGGSDQLWMNGLYDALAVIFMFPLIVWLGAGGALDGEFSARVCRFLGDISYPVYIVHYPLIYVFTAWVVNNKVPMHDAWPQAVLLLLGSIALAYAGFKMYDLPVRRWLVRRFILRGRMR